MSWQISAFFVMVKISKNITPLFWLIPLYHVVVGLAGLYLYARPENSNLHIPLLLAIVLLLFQVFTGIMGFLRKWVFFKLVIWCQIIQVLWLAAGPLKFFASMGVSWLFGAEIVEGILSVDLFKIRFGTQFWFTLNGYEEQIGAKLNIFPFVVIHFSQVFRNKAIDLINR